MKMALKEKRDLLEHLEKMVYQDYKENLDEEVNLDVMVRIFQEKLANKENVVNPVMLVNLDTQEDKVLFLTRS